MLDPTGDGAPTVRSYHDSGVVIAGGSGGVGLAAALGFIDAGVRKIVLLGRNVERGTAARDLVGARAERVEATFVPVEADDVDEVFAAVDSARDILGSIDVLVSSLTAAYTPDLLHRIPPKDMARILTAQALPPMYFTRAVLPIMREQGGGSIVNIASDAAKVPTPGESVLGAAMSAIVMFSRTAAIEGKRDGIRVNVLTPSLIAGTATAERVLSDGFSRSLFEKAARQAHLGVAEPIDIAELVVYLGGPAAARLTGQTISVNGGISIA
ncbi:oxidoreductase [Frondihabitans sp. PAMC 28766]|uniref:SDR family NAD(P)-dependent oxidoreductase n=1 Tax=Frondihabitans sp. PAMC 28766 TaxID=1795630 RepID=UPI00078C1F46|nr:SDR family oxidoreductase [Frondihabitans sp. PAMC 28766]AMM21871.1 oxidoreductase [Frondihabitans sp. PAMC 28766]